MPPPVAVYVVAAVVGVAALFAFKEYVYEPHLAPKIEAWAEDFLERRRARRNRRASAVPVNSSRRHRNSVSSSDSSHHSNNVHGDPGEHNEAQGLIDLRIDEFELEALTSKEVDEWRNEVLRSQERTRVSLRRRRAHRPEDDLGGLDGTSTTLDESFTSLTRTPLAYVISNISSPITTSTLSLPKTPPGRHRSESQSTTTQSYANTLLIDLPPPFSATHEIPALVPRTPSPMLAEPTTGPPRGGAGDFGVTSPTPLVIPDTGDHPPAIETAPRPLPFTPTYQIMAEDSPFGPLLPDTPRSSAEMYGERPFSPITRVMGSSSGTVSTSGSIGSHSSRASSTNSIRTLGGAGVLRKGSGLVNEVVMTDSDSSDEENHPRAPTPNFAPANAGPGVNESVISSLSERYPAPPTPPIILSPSPSSIGVVSAPSSPSSGSSGVVVRADGLNSTSHSPFQPRSEIHPPLPLLQLPPDSPNAGQISRARSQMRSSISPALSYASFLSPLPLSRGVSESGTDEFLSVASDDSEWSTSPVTPGGDGHVGPIPDQTNNPFLDFEDLAHGSDEGEVIVSNVGQEGGSEIGSEESWGSARRH